MCVFVYVRARVALQPPCRDSGARPDLCVRRTERACFHYQGQELKYGRITREVLDIVTDTHSQSQNQSVGETGIYFHVLLVARSTLSQLLL